jgi:hypothetical protein
LADSAPAFVSALNSVLFPTLGSPTIPNFILLYISLTSDFYSFLPLFFE